jgi:hypothetical protein
MIDTWHLSRDSLAAYSVSQLTMSFSAKQTSLEQLLSRTAAKVLAAQGR